LARQKKDRETGSKAAANYFARSINFPNEMRKRIERDAAREHRSFNGQVLYLLEIAAKALEKETGEKGQLS